MLEELATLTAEQREVIIDQALKLNDTPFTEEEERLIEERLEFCRKHPESCLTLSEFETRLKSRLNS